MSTLAPLSRWPRNPWGGILRGMTTQNLILLAGAGALLLLWVGIRHVEAGQLQPSDLVTLLLYVMLLAGMIAASLAFAAALLPASGMTGAGSPGSIIFCHGIVLKALTTNASGCSA